MADKTNNKNFKKSFNRWFWGIFIAGLLSVAGIFFFINIGWLGYLPAIDPITESY